MRIQIRNLTVDDIPQADQTLRLAFGTPGSRVEEMHRLLALQPDGWRVAICDGRLIGTVGAVDYGPFAWIGQMSVHPEVQRQGIGALLMADILDWLDRRGCAFIRLDATRAGSDLYRKMGFVTAGRTLFFSDSKLYPLPQDGWTVAPMEVTDLPGVAALDAAAFGARRDKLLRMYWDRHPGRCFIARDRNGALMGYLVAQEGRIGPLVAETRQAAEILLKTGLDLPYAERLVRLIVPEENSTGVDLFRRLGFVEGPSHLHMVKTGGARAPSGGGKPGPGMVLPGKREMIYAQASFATG